MRVRAACSLGRSLTLRRAAGAGAPARRAPTATAHARPVRRARPPASSARRSTVPLDRSGAVPGTVSLAVAARRATVEPAATRRVRGARRRPGPGGDRRSPRTSPQILGAGAGRPRPARLRPARHRRLGPAQLPRAARRPLERLRAAGAQAARAQLGAARGFYRTADSVEDIEAIRAGRRLRQARALRRLLRHEGRARAYAAALPRATSRRSCSTRSCARRPRPVPTARRFSASPRVLRRAVRRAAPAAAITGNPRATSRRSAARLAQAPPARHGRRRPRRAGARARMSDARPARTILLARRPQPDAARRAARRRALARCTATARRCCACSARARDWQRRPTAPSRRRATATRCSSTTTCEETPFPWDRSAGPVPRAPSATAAAARDLPREQLAPFDRAPRCSGGSIRAVPRLARRLAAAAAHGPLPAVPTLVLDGEADLRTPVEDARARRRADPRRASSSRSRTPATRSSAPT